MARSARKLRRLINFYPPLLGAGIRVTRMSEDMREVDVQMRLRWWNRNYVGTHFGGSLFAMTDPFYVLMLLHNLGTDFIVWDKAATIRFRKPGKGTVRARFRVTQEDVDSLRAQLRIEEKIEPTFKAVVLNDAGEVVAEVDKLLYIRRKETAPQ